MTENEAIQEIKKIYVDTNQSDKCIALKMAISALLEIQKYREIGTVEECREARERQRTKKPINLEYVRDDYSWMGECPFCGAYVSENKKYCLMCGQHLDWSKS